MILSTANQHRQNLVNTLIKFMPIWLERYFYGQKLIHTTQTLKTWLLIRPISYKYNPRHINMTIKILLLWLTFLPSVLERYFPGHFLAITASHFTKTMASHLVKAMTAPHHGPWLYYRVRVQKMNLRRGGLGKEGRKEGTGGGGGEAGRQNKRQVVEEDESRTLK